MNSDLNSAQNSALHQVKSCALRAHGLRSCAHTPRSRAQRAQVARMLGVHWSRHAQAACPRSRPQSSRSRHQTTTRQPESCRDIKSVSRRQPHVATSLPPNETNQVVTSKIGSRLQFPTCQVVTSIPCRDLLSILTTTNQVATSLLGRDLLETNLCRDIDFMSRPRSCPQWDFQVATSKSRSRPPTLLPMSRPQK